MKSVSEEIAAQKASKPEPVSVIAYKGFDKNMQCRGFQFEVGKTYKHEGKVRACESGFHVCENPLDVLNYYDLADNRFAIVSVSGELSRHAGDSKIAAGEITVTAELRLPDFIKAGINYLLSLTKDADKGATVDSGNYSQLAASGYYSQLAASGYGSQLAASGNYSQLAASGDGSKLAASGYGSKLAASGDYSQLAASGYGSSVTLGKNGAACLPFHDGTRCRFVSFYEGENGIEAGIAYCLNSSGQVVKVQP